MNNRHHRRYVLFIQAAIGAVLGILILHPLTTFVYWFEFNEFLPVSTMGIWDFFVSRLRSETFFELVPMNLVFALIGVVFGLIFGGYHRALEIEHYRVLGLQQELNTHLPSLIEKGETERVEFKSTMRWDLREKRSNKILEQVIAKSISGLMNHLGGSLIIGVNDAGGIVGIDADCQTLKHKNVDGFECALMDIVRTMLGAHACTLIHCQFSVLEGKTICWLIIERATLPIYFQNGKVAQYFVRIGNSTREMDVREAHAHVAQKQGSSYL